MRDPVGVIGRAYETLGPAFVLSLGPKTMACFIGPEYAAEYFRQPGEVLSINLAAEPVKPIMGDIAFPDGKKEHRRLLDALTPLVTKSHLEQHARVMLQEAERAALGLPAEGELELVGFTERLSQTIAVRCILGDAFAQGTDARFREAFSALIKSFDLFVPPNLPLPKFRRRDRARAYLDRIIGEAVDERRGMADAPADTMQWLSTLRDERGEYWSMEQTVDLVVSVLFGSHHTTGSLMAWTIVHVLRHPNVLARLREEVGGPALTIDRLAGLAYLSAVVQESGRYDPPTGIITRVARRDLTLGGFGIRKGWIVALCPPVAQRLPEVFEHPERYDPGRFLDGKPLPRHALIVFGGGAHACIGKAFAQQAVRTFVGTALQHLELELVGAPVVEAKEILRRPVVPCLVRHRRRA